MSKKPLAALGLAFGMLLSLLVGVGSAAPAQADTCTTTIKIWSFGDVFLPRLILQYKQQNPGVCFDIKKSDLDPLNGTNMITACAAANSHTGPDIAAVEIQYSGYWRSYPQCFVDLKTLRRTSDNKNAYDLRTQYLPWRWNNGVAYNGAIIGMPTDVGGLEVFPVRRVAAVEVVVVDLDDQLGLGAELHGRQLLPIGTVYDPFVCRGLDALIYSVYSGARFIFAGTPSGVSLSREGGAHQSAITASIGMELPGVTLWEPCYALETEWAMLHALRDIVRMLETEEVPFTPVIFNGLGATRVTHIPDPCGGTPMHLGLMLARSLGAERIVLVSDGIPDSPEAALQARTGLGRLAASLRL